MAYPKSNHPWAVQPIRSFGLYSRYDSYNDTESNIPDYLKTVAEPVDYTTTINSSHPINTGPAHIHSSAPRDLFRFGNDRYYDSVISSERALKALWPKPEAKKEPEKYSVEKVRKCILVLLSM